METGVEKLLDKSANPEVFPQLIRTVTQFLFLSCVMRLPVLNAEWHLLGGVKLIISSFLKYYALTSGVLQHWEKPWEKEIG